MTREEKSTPDPSVRALFMRSICRDSDRRFAVQSRRESTPGFDQDETEAGGTGSRYSAIKGELQERLLEDLGQGQEAAADGTSLRETIDDFVTDLLENETLALNESERRHLADELLDETLGVGPLAPLMGDPAVTDILVNGPESVYVERFGNLEKTPIRFRDDEHIVRVIERIAARVGRHIDVASPMLDARLPDGSRVNATLPPVSLDGPTLSIRRFGRRRLRCSDLQRLGSASDQMLAFLGHVVGGRLNVLVSGGTGAGKSTLLGALAESIPGDERIVTIEDAAELVLDQHHVVRLETRPPNVEGQGRITQRDLVINTLRMRPDRIIVGEVRSDEALDMLQAMNTGHDGSLSTIHANSPRDALSRLETMVLLSGVDLPSRAIREQIASAIQVLVHIRRYEDGVRRIETICEVAGLEENVPLLNEIYRFERKGLSGRRVEGRFAATGTIPRASEALGRRGAEMPRSLFRNAWDES